MTLTVEYAVDTLAQYRIRLDGDGRRLREVGDPRFFATDHASPLPFFAFLDETDWHHARQLAPYHPRRNPNDDDGQPPLFRLAPEQP